MDINRIFDLLRDPAAATVATRSVTRGDLRSVGEARYGLLVTYRRSGTPVATPVWLAGRGTRLYARSEGNTGKVKRVRANSRAAVAQCTFRGRPTGPVFAAQARLLPDEEEEIAEAALAAKYGLLRRVYRRVFPPGHDGVYIELVPLASEGRLRTHRSAVATTAPAVDGIRLTPLTPSAHADAAAVCADAFESDPGMRALAPHAATRHAMLRMWFRGLIRIARRHAGRPIVGAYAEGELVAVCGAFEPGRYPVPIRSAILAAPGPMRAGPRVARGALRWLIARDENHPRKPHLYLETLATAPTHQGQGIGSALLRQLCSEADHRQLPILLYTNNPRNLEYYERFGFVIVRITELPTGASEWLMRRTPGASRNR